MQYQGIREFGEEEEGDQTKACTEPCGEGVCGEEKGLVALTTEISKQTAVMAVSAGEQGGCGHVTSTFSATHSIWDLAPSPY